MSNIQTSNSVLYRAFVVSRRSDYVGRLRGAGFYGDRTTGMLSIAGAQIQSELPNSMMELATSSVSQSRLPSCLSGWPVTGVTGLTVYLTE